MNTFLPAHAGANRRGGKRWRWGEGGCAWKCKCVCVWWGTSGKRGREKDGWLSVTREWELHWGGSVAFSVCVCEKVRDMFLYSCMQVHGFPSVSLHLCLTHTRTRVRLLRPSHSTDMSGTVKTELSCSLLNILHVCRFPAACVRVCLLRSAHLLHSSAHVCYTQTHISTLTCLGIDREVLLALHQCVHELGAVPIRRVISICRRHLDYRRACGEGRRGRKDKREIKKRRKKRRRERK